MTGDDEELSELLDRVRLGDSQAKDHLFRQYRDRLKRMVQLRMDRRLQKRFDASDVLQEAQLEVSRKLDDYLQNPSVPFFLWLRSIAGLKLQELHRNHLGRQARDAAREVTLHRGAMPEANSFSLAKQLLGKFSSPSNVAIKAEMRLKLQEALNSMDELDREILALRHFEQLNNKETAEVLGMTPSGAAARYVRSLKRLKMLLQKSPGFFN